MSVSGQELLRRVREHIVEVDPTEVLDQLGNPDVTIIDVREAEEVAQGKIRGAVHVPRSYLETRIEGIAPDRSKRVILYCASGNRSAFGAKTLAEDMGYEHVESLTGGITLWKDRGYPVEVPRTLTPEQRQRYSRHLLLPEVGADGQQKLLDAKVLLLGAGGLGSPTALYLAAAGVGTHRHRRRRRRRRLEPAAPGHPHAPAASASSRSTPPNGRSTTSTPTSRSSSTRRASTPPTSSRSSRAGTWSSTASTTSRPATC